MVSVSQAELEVRPTWRGFRESMSGFSLSLSALIFSIMLFLSLAKSVPAIAVTLEVKVSWAGIFVGFPSIILMTFGFVFADYLYFRSTSWSVTKDRVRITRRGKELAVFPTSQIVRVDKLKAAIRIWAFIGGKKKEFRMCYLMKKELSALQALLPER